MVENLSGANGYFVSTWARSFNGSVILLPLGVIASGLWKCFPATFPGKYYIYLLALIVNGKFFLSLNGVLERDMQTVLSQIKKQF